LQLVSSTPPSFSMSSVNWTYGHDEHELVTENGFTMGFNMYEPTGQHPRRPVSEVTEVNGMSALKVSHAPPHNVRLNAVPHGSGAHPLIPNATLILFRTPDYDAKKTEKKKGIRESEKVRKEKR
jgi:hypothetical protein